VASANVQLVRSITESMARGDFTSAEWADADVEYVIADGPQPGRFKGLAEMADGFRDFLGAWIDYRVAPDEYRELDDEHVLVLTHHSGRGRTSGIEISQIQACGAFVFHIREGKVLQLVAYLDRERGLAELGLDGEAASSGSAGE
jgi:ketosteroid isomerase-like protein